MFNSAMRKLAWFRSVLVAASRMDLAGVMLAVTAAMRLYADLYRVWLMAVPRIASRMIAVVDSHEFSQILCAFKGLLESRAMKELVSEFKPLNKKANTIVRRYEPKMEAAAREFVKANPDLTANK